MNNSNSRSGRIARNIVLLLLVAAFTVAGMIAIGRMNSTQQTDLAVPEASSQSDAPSASDVQPPPPKPDSLTITMAGDCLLHEGLRENARVDDNSFDFSHQLELMEGTFCADLNIVNMETPIDAHGDNKKLRGYPCFNGPIEYAEAIADMGIDVGITANNHCLDNGWNGLVNNINNIRALGIDTIGTYTSPEERNEPYIREINGIKVGIVAFTDNTNGLKLEKSRESYALCRLDKASTVIEEVDKLRAQGAEYIIASIHWGEEYTDEPIGRVVTMAQRLCEGGVDLIMGHHPHVVQPIKKLTVTRADGSERDCLVIYSLGNYFASQGRPDGRTRQTMTVSARLERGEDGIVRLTDAFYMPVMMYSSSSDPDFMRLIPMGRYLSSAQPPEFISEADMKNYCRPAWDHVVKVAGDEIPIVTAPEEYPDWLTGNNK